MTIDEAVTYIEDIKNGLHETGKDFPYRDEVIPVAKEALDIAIKALEQEPQTDEIILSKKEYRELLSNEFEHGYDKGLSDAIKSLEQESMLDKIRAEIDSYCSDNRDRNDGLYIAMQIIDKHTGKE